jgi:hypothetical protein
MKRRDHAYSIHIEKLCRAVLNPRGILEHGLLGARTGAAHDFGTNRSKLLFEKPMSVGSDGRRSPGGYTGGE